MLGDPERVEAEIFGFPRERLDAGGLVEPEIRPGERRKIHAKSHRHALLVGAGLAPSIIPPPDGWRVTERPPRPMPWGRPERALQ